MNRIDLKFAELKRIKRKAFIPFITAGDPDLRATEELVLSFENAGASIVELGVPFSDPLADGPTIQESSQRALKKGVNLPMILEMVARIRRKSGIPIALMTYYNPVFHYGEKRFVQDAKESGVDGVIIPDLPPEEARTLIPHARRHDLATVFFLAPTTTIPRMKSVVKFSTGFIYYVAVAGVTGARARLSKESLLNIHFARKLTSNPVCVGFGVSTPLQVAEAAKIADGVIVGSAIIQQIEKNRGKKQMVANVARFVSGLARGLD